MEGGKKNHMLSQSCDAPPNRGHDTAQPVAKIQPYSESAGFAVRFAGVCHKEQHARKCNE